MLTDTQKYYACELHNLSLCEFEKLTYFKESITLALAFFAGLTAAFAMCFMVKLMLLSLFIFIATLALRIVIEYRFKKFVENNVLDFQKDLGEFK